MDYPSILWIAAQKDPKQKLNYARLAKLNTLIISAVPIQCSHCTLNFTDAQVHYFCGCSSFSEAREIFWERIVDECQVHISAELWNMSDSDLTETLLGRQMDNFDENLQVIKIAAECWKIEFN